MDIRCESHQPNLVIFSSVFLPDWSTISGLQNIPIRIVSFISGVKVLKKAIK